MAVSFWIAVASGRPARVVTLWPRAIRARIRGARKMVRESDWPPISTTCSGRVALVSEPLTA